MTLDQFVSKYLGKKIDWDGAYGGQCVDLFRQYAQEVLGFPQAKGVRGAADFWTNYESDPALKNNYDRIANTPTGVPQKGDVMLWDKDAGGGYGHVAVFLEGNTSSFTSFDQNWPTLSVCTKTKHDYTNVYGWLRPKSAPAGTYKGIDLSNTDSVKAAIDTWKDVVDGKYVRREELDKVLTDKEGLYQETQRLSGLVNELKLELAGEKKQTAELQSVRQAEIEKIAAAVGSLADVPSILKFVEMNTEETEQFRKKVKSLEAQLSEAQSARQDEIDQLKRDIDQLRQVNERQAAHIGTLETRLASLETSGQTIVPIWEKIMEIIAIFRKGAK